MPAPNFRLPIAVLLMSRSSSLLLTPQSTPDRLAPERAVLVPHALGDARSKNGLVLVRLDRPAHAVRRHHRSTQRAHFGAVSAGHRPAEDIGLVLHQHV